MASLFLAVGTEGLSNSSRPWAGGQVANVPCVGWEPSDTTDHHNGHEVTDAITCGRGWGARFPEEQDSGGAGRGLSAGPLSLCFRFKRLNGDE